MHGISIIARRLMSPISPFEPAPSPGYPGRAAGGGLHRRSDPGGLRVCYWRHAAGSGGWRDGRRWPRRATGVLVQPLLAMPRISWAGGGWRTISGAFLPQRRCRSCKRTPPIPLYPGCRRDGLPGWVVVLAGAGRVLPQAPSVYRGVTSSCGLVSNRPALSLRRAPRSSSMMTPSPGSL
jgi:hypothetical protein